MRPKKCFLRALPVILSLFFCAPSFAAQDTPSAVLSACRSVLRIQTSAADADSFGSGFIISNGRDGTYIATNHHVISDNPQGITVWLSNEEHRSATAVVQSEQLDLAILRLSPPCPDRPALPISADAQQGAAVYALGFPGYADYLTDDMAVSTEDITITDGLISAVRQTALVSYGPKVTILQINAAINPGNSGGPLVDSAGNVVGINALSITGSDGIGGAISARELLSLMKEAGIDTVRPKSGVFLYVLLGVAAAAAVGGGVLLLLRARKKRAVPLGAFLNKKGGRLAPEEAVRLMMPVVLETRALHQEGRLLLKLSPEAVWVRGDRAAIDQKRMAENRLSVEFAAPEQLAGSRCSANTDVYAVCALLAYLTGGGAAALPADSDFSNVLRKGMQKDPEARYASMQSLIEALAPFNMYQAPPARAAAAEAIPGQAFPACSAEIPAEIPAEISAGMPAEISAGMPAAVPQPVFAQLAVSAAPEAMPEAAKAVGSGKRKKRRWVLIASCAALLGLLSVAGHCYGNYVCAVRKMAEADLSGAAAHARNIWFYVVVPQDDWKYLSAAMWADEGNYEKACSLFSELDAHRNSRELVSETQYLHAGRLADRSDFKQAIAIYGQLGDYKDSGELAFATRYRLGMQQLSNGSLEDAVTTFRLLAEAGYDPAQEILPDAMCQLGMQQLEQASYSAAVSTFKKLIKSGYSQAQEMLSEAYYQWGCSKADEEDYCGAYKLLKEIESYSDTRQLLSSLRELIYAEGQTCYWVGSFAKAKERFGLISGYSRAADYLTLINTRNTGGIFVGTDYAPSLVKLVGFEDANWIILSSWSFAKHFLVGEWKSSSNYLKFVYKDPGKSSSVYCSYNLPYYDWGDSFTVVDGILRLEKRDSSEYKNMFKFTIISKDCMEVYAYKNGKTYTLYRQ